MLFGYLVSLAVILTLDLVVGQISFYKAKDFGGANLDYEASQIEEQGCKNLPADWVHAVSSLNTQGYRYLVYSQPNCNGEVALFGPDDVPCTHSDLTACFGGTVWNQRIASFQPVGGDRAEIVDVYWKR